MSNTLYRPLTIGNVVLDGNIILAPMAGVTDLPFRLLCREQGSALQCMEMVSAKAILYNNKNTDALMEIHPDEMPSSLQLFGSDPQIMGDMARRIDERPHAVLDINMGCPVPKVFNNGEGSALMQNVPLVSEIVANVVKGSSRPVTVKIRKGINDSCVNAVEVAKAAESAGASAIIVHGRTREQYYAGEADWDIIRQVKEAVKIPVIGNGDIVDGKSAEKMMRETGCDGVAIGRAVRGNPFIFREVIHYLKTGETMPRPDKKEIYETIIRHAKLQLEYKGEYIGIREMRKHFAWYTTGIPGASRARGRVNEMETMDDILKVANEVFGDG